MRSIINGIITTVLGLALAGIGIYVYIENRATLFNWTFTQLAAPGLLIVAGVVLVLSPDEFVKKFFAQFKRRKD